MAKISYDQARADFEYLESIHELDDQVELDAMRLDLMRNPTKKMAAEMYQAGCRLWFAEHPSAAFKEWEIAERYCAALKEPTP